MVCVPFMTTILQNIRYDLPFIVVGLSGIVVGLLGISLPETKDKPTRETFEDFYNKGNLCPRLGEQMGTDNVGQDTASC